MTYNVLAEWYKGKFFWYKSTGHQDYKGTSDEILSWETRYKHIIKEIDQQSYMEDCKLDGNDPSNTSPDIICIQELHDIKLTKYLTEQSNIKYEYFSQKKGGK